MSRRINETRSSTGARFLFTGRELIPETALYDYRNRVYSPTLGRFLQPDPIRFSAGDVNLYRYVSNNPVNLWDPDGLDAVPAPGGGYNFVVRPGLNLKNLAGSSITHPNDRFSGQCATGAQFLTGTNVNGRIHDAPSTRTWRPGEPVGKGMRPGTMVATGWENGRYPSRAASSYAKGEIVNHCGIFLGMNRGIALIFDQSTGRPLAVTPTDPNGWHAVVSDKKHDSRPSECAAKAKLP
jgi:RHS repeat-associated protein